MMRGVSSPASVRTNSARTPHDSMSSITRLPSGSRPSRAAGYESHPKYDSIVSTLAHEPPAKNSGPASRAP